jgi:hypothetical protein
MGGWERIMSSLNINENLDNDLNKIEYIKIFLKLFILVCIFTKQK